MNISQLEYFCDIAETLNYTLSAKRLNVTQSALSQSIMRLETELGVPLFIRCGRGVSLTKCGETFRKTATRTISLISSGIDEVRGMFHRQSQPMRIGFITGINESYIFSVFEAFYKKYPQIPIMLSECPPRLMNIRIRENSLDWIFTYRVAQAENLNPSGLIGFSLFKTPFVAWISDKNPLSKEKTLSAYQLKDETILAHSEETIKSYLSFFDFFCADIFKVVSNPRMTARLVAENMGIAIKTFPPPVEKENPGIKIIPITGRISEYLLCMNKFSSLNATGILFKDFVLSYVKRHPYTISPYPSG